MNALVNLIQEEKDYERFEALFRELNELMIRRLVRFPQHNGSSAHGKRPSKTISGMVQRIVKGAYPDNAERAEITIAEAEYLFREIRVENTFTDVDGRPVALKQGARVDNPRSQPKRYREESDRWA